MKRIDKTTERRLYWLFIPMAVVVVWLVTFLWTDYNIAQQWFGLDIDVLEWAKPILIASVAIIFLGYGIAAFCQKCWGELAAIAVVFIIMLLNMSNFFVELLMK